MEDEEMARRQEFAEKLIPSSRSQLRVLRQSYQVKYCIKMFLNGYYSNRLPESVWYLWLDTLLIYYLHTHKRIRYGMSDLLFSFPLKVGFE